MPSYDLPFPVRLPAILLRYWADPRAESYADSIVDPFCELPGVRRLGPRLVAVLPIPDDPGEVSTAMVLAERMVASYRRHLPVRRREEMGQGLGVVAAPGWVRVSGQRVSYEPEPLLDDLVLRPPQIPRDKVYLTGYATYRLDATWKLAAAPTYTGISGAGATLFEKAGRRADARPWHNARLLGRERPYLARPDIERRLSAHRDSPILRVSGPLGCGKTRLVWQALGPGAQAGVPCLWVPVPAWRLGEGLASRLLRRLAREVAGGDLGDLQAGLDRLGLAAHAAWLAGPTAERLPARLEAGELAALLTGAILAASACLGGALRVVIDDLQTIVPAEIELLAELLAEPALAVAGVRWVLIARSRDAWPAALAGSPEVLVPPMSAAEITGLVQSHSAGLDMPSEVLQRLAEAASGFPLALEEDLAQMTHARHLRSHYGNYFFSGPKTAEPEPTPRLVQLLEAEASALGDPLPIRLLAVCGTAMPTRELAAAADAVGEDLSTGWEKPFLASGWVWRARSPWGPGVDLAAGSYARAFAQTVPAEDAPEICRAMGELLSDESSDPNAVWHAYRLLAGSVEAVSSILALAREFPTEVPAQRLLTGLVDELNALRERGGDPATELQLLWILLPLARRTDCLPQFEKDLDRALEIAQDEPRKLLALASLKAELDLVVGHYGAGEGTVRAVLDRVLAADPSRQALLLLQLGRLLERQGKRQEALTLFERLLVAAQEQEREALAATCRFHLGNIALFEQRFRHAQILHRAALGTRRREGSGKSVGVSLCALGAVELELGNYPEALMLYGEAEKVLAEHGEDGEESFAQLGLGRAQGEMGEHPAALRCLRRALALREARPDRMGEAVVRLALAEVHLDAQQIDKALAEARVAYFHLSLGEEISHLGDAEQLLGRIELARRHFLAAGTHLAAALDIHQRHGAALAVLVDQSWQLELALAQEDGRELRRLAAILAGQLDEIPARHRAGLAFRLAGGCQWLRGHDQGGQGADDPKAYLERSYQDLLGKASVLPAEMRHNYLFEIAEHAAIVAAATAHHLVA